MINYSIVMRSVNANLLEINQAKSRINQAKKEGTTPDPKDLELVKTEKQNAFAISQVHRHHDHREVCQAHHLSWQCLFKSRHQRHPLHCRRLHA